MKRHTIPYRTPALASSIGWQGRTTYPLELENTMTATLTKPAKVKLAHIDTLAQQLADARAQRKLWESKEADLAEKLLAAHEAGVAPTKFATAGWSFTFQEGRQTVQYPEVTLAQIKDLQAAAVVAGQTTIKVGRPFYKIVPAKEEA
jgi:hypothetical protein